MSTSKETPRTAPPTTLVIPCFNEAERLDTDRLDRALGTRPWLSLVFVDDGSTDRTADVLARFAGDREQRVEVVTLVKNSGKAEAVRRGMLHCLTGDAEIIGYWDADLSTPIETVDLLVSELLSRGAVLAMGARVKLLGRAIERQPLRHYAGRIFATCASLALKISVYDTQCGAKIFHHSAPLESIFGHPFETRWIFDVEILSRLLSAGPPLILDRIIEVPLEQWVDVAGSKLRPTDFLSAALDLATLAHNLRRRRSG